MTRHEIDADHLPLPTLFSVGDDGTHEAVVEAPSVRDLRWIAVAIHANEGFRREWNARAIDATRPLGQDDLILRAVKSPDSDRLRVGILAPDGKVVGRHDSYPSSWRTEFVLDRRTLNGASWLEDRLRGRGVGTVLYDYVEEISGIPLTPHGHFLVEGSLNDSSLSFWTKRMAVEGRSLLASGECLRRMDLIEASDRGLHADRSDLSDPYLAAVLASRLGGEVAGFEAPGWRHRAIVRDADGRLHPGTCVPGKGVELEFASPDEAWTKVGGIPQTGFLPFPRTDRFREQTEARIDEFLRRNAAREGMTGPSLGILDPDTFTAAP